MPMTPEKINEKISEFLISINNECPFYIDVVPEPESLVNECFLNVQRKVELEGGSLIMGWQIWEAKYLIEAEFHGVWKKPSGELIDITPKSIKTIDKILFLPEPNKSYTGVHVDNIRKNCTGNRLVDDLILVSELGFHVLNKGNRAKMKEVQLTHSENLRVQKLNTIKSGLLAMLHRDSTIQSVCFCGEQLSYKKYHGKELTKLSKSS